MRPGLSGWGLGVGLRTSPRKKLPVKKQKCGLGPKVWGGPLWRQRPPMAIVPTKEEKNIVRVIKSRRLGWSEQVPGMEEGKECFKNFNR